MMIRLVRATTHPFHRKRLVRQRQSIICYESSSSEAVVSGKRRSFWTWSGGDDKRWKELRGGAIGDGEDDRIDAAAPQHLDVLHHDDDVEVSPSLPPSPAPMSICTAQGYRSYMEDEFFANSEGTFCAVFDGHGGHQVSRYLRQNLYGYVLGALEMPTTTTSTATSTHATDDADTSDDGPEKEPSSSVAASPSSSASSTTTTAKPSPDVAAYTEALQVALEKVDKEVQRISHWSFQGSTAVAVWLHENAATAKRTMIVANVGDSRAVLCRNSTAYDLTRDHKPNDPIEQERIEALGGKVIWCGDVDRFGEPIEETGVYRVNGNLALARAIGDRSERTNGVTAESEITTASVDEELDQFILVATDGLWDVFEALTDGRDRDRIATLLVEEALRRGTYDNITVVILWLDQQQQRPLVVGPHLGSGLGTAVT
jgi:serine/threonine protein phosphatase PrpC